MIKPYSSSNGPPFASTGIVVTLKPKAVCREGEPRPQAASGARGHHACDGRLIRDRCVLTHDGPRVRLTIDFASAVMPSPSVAAVALR
jgi:hypothetical protein